MVDVPTTSTKKLRLTPSIAFLRMPTGKTSLAGVAGIDQYHGDPCPLRLIGQEGTQLGERPIALSGALLRTPNPCPRADARQFFQGDGALRALGGSNKTFAQNVVGVALKAALPTGQLTETALGRQGATRLKVRAILLETLAGVLDALAGVDCAIAVGGDVRHAEVNAKRIVKHLLVRIGNVAGSEQVELALAIDKIGLALLKLQQGKLPVSGYKWHVLPPAHRPDRHGLFVCVPRQDATIVGNRPQWAKRALRLAIKFVGIGHLGSEPRSHLCCQAKSFPYRAIPDVVHSVLPERLRIPSEVAQEVGSGIARLNGFSEQVGLLW